MISRIRHKPKYRTPVFGHQAWSDRILYNENRNPYRKGTPQHDYYNQDYDYADSVLQPASKLKPNPQGPDTGQRRP